ncbi:MAG: 2Fe-2S iron-sulfur cluster binding domain protein [Parcubacteria group bacterium GW2011_GWA1_36_12]|nr:MAG: 2Fe-2S iron-sulfur cluster binding domain protein [Parcubacteria group bacterium GW2011_GWA1_36_12]
MAKIISEDGKEIEVKDGDKIDKACEELGVIIACSDGTCGVCKTEIIKGMENLNKINEKEKEMGCENNERLACQCIIKKGEIKIKPAF